MIEYKPNFSEKEAVHFVHRFYGLKSTATLLPGERDQNYHIHADSGKQCVLKISNTQENKDLLDAQTLAMIHLSKHTTICPHVIRTLSGEFISVVQSKNGVSHFIRMVSYLPGIPLGQSKRHSKDLFYHVGQCMGEMDHALIHFDHPAFHRDFYWDLAQAMEVVLRYRSLILDTELGKLIDKIMAEYQINVVPLLARLRKSVIHNDANDYNLLVGGGDDLYTKNQKLVGLIDFGDMIYSHTICDLAIAIAYAILEKPDPMETAFHMVRGYHLKFPIDEDELSVLFGLIRIRLCVSVCMAAYQQKQRPDDEYLGISQKPIQKTLPKLAAIPPRLALATFRHACGLPPVNKTQTIYSWIRRHEDHISPILNIDFKTEPVTILDLGIGSPLVSGGLCTDRMTVLTDLIFDSIKEKGARMGIGMYNEARLIYTAPEFKSEIFGTDEDSTVHLGIDLYASPDTTVYAPLPGIVHAYKNNEKFLDYGPVIILQHETDEGELFYTLYGHLSIASLKDLQKGKPVKSGDKIGTIGSKSVNGGWPPHLHFQIITDLMTLETDFPGICPASQRNVWNALSPDPNIILKIPMPKSSVSVKNKKKTLEHRQKFLGRNLSIGYKTPVQIEKGWMQYLFDETGRKYLDAYNNVPHVGHCHPDVVKAACRQMSVLNTNTRYLNDFLNHYAKTLCATMPGPLNVCFFVNSASEGNELALRLARTHTRHRDLIVLKGAYHGHTTTLIDISPYKHDGPGGMGSSPWVHTAPVADLFRGPYKTDDPDAAFKYARYIETITKTLKDKGIGLCGFIAESCPSVGGQIIFPDDYLKMAYKYIRDAGGVCIADEVQTGYGRIGSHFYAFEAQNVIPDIVVLGKPIGNGHPISAVVTTSQIAASFNNGMEFFSTFGGNTVSCAIGLAVLDVVKKEGLQAHAKEVGQHLLSELKNLKDRYSIIGDVRGAGLFLGMELVRDHETLEPAGEEASFISDRMREYGVLLGTDGPYHNVIKIRPPMPFSKKDADLLVSVMDKVLREDFDN